jgi:hypothetical protein
LKNGGKEKQKFFEKFEASLAEVNTFEINTPEY